MRAVVADRVPGLVERQAPVHAHDVAAGLGDVGQNGGGADAEVDQRARRTPLSASKIRPRVGQRELAVVGAAQRAGPRIEDLDGLHAGLDLRASGSRAIMSAKRAAQPVPGLRLRRT